MVVLLLFMRRLATPANFCRTLMAAPIKNKTTRVVARMWRMAWRRPWRRPRRRVILLLLFRRFRFMATVVIDLVAVVAWDCRRIIVVVPHHHFGKEAIPLGNKNVSERTQKVSSEKVILDRTLFVGRAPTVDAESLTSADTTESVRLRRKKCHNSSHLLQRLHPSPSRSTSPISAMFVSSLDAWLTPSHIHYDCLGSLHVAHKRHVRIVSCDAWLTLHISTMTVWVSVSCSNFASGKRWQHHGLALVKCLG